MLPVAAGVAVLGAILAWLATSQPGFVPQACQSVESYLPTEIIGQDLALSQITDAICHHLARPRPGRPLIISAHGPPGVGKTLTHQLLARALYSPNPPAALDCPGPDCRGYKVFYGMDYLVSEKAARLSALRDALLSHLRAVPESLIVVEEYDKLDCAARGLWRQLLQHPERANVTWDRAIVIMESNLGMSELERLITEAGGRDKISAEDAERRMRDLVFAHWQSAGCEAFEDTLKMTSLVDFYVPYFPLERPHVAELARRQLAARGAELRARKGLDLEWDEAVVKFLVGKVEFSGPFPMEGAKGIHSAVTRHAARHLRKAPPQPRPQPGASGAAGAAAARMPALVLSVAAGGLESRVVGHAPAGSRE